MIYLTSFCWYVQKLGSYACYCFSEYNHKPVGFASFCFDFPITHGSVLLLKNFYVDKSLTAERVHQQLMSKILNLTKEAGEPVGFLTFHPDTQNDTCCFVSEKISTSKMVYFFHCLIFLFVYVFVVAPPPPPLLLFFCFPRL